jgi:hypothetical protein
MLDPSEGIVADGGAVQVFDEAHVAEGAGAVVEEGEFEFEEVFGAGVFALFQSSK